MKHLLTLCAVVSILPATILIAPPTEDERDRNEFEEIKLSIVSNYTSTFSEDNIYKKPLKADNWNKLVAGIHDFVKKHQNKVQQYYDANTEEKVFLSFRSSTLQRNKELLKDYDKLKTASNELVNTINAAYTELFNSQEPKDAKTRDKAIAKFSKKFEAIHHKITNLTAHLEDQIELLLNKISAEKSEIKKQMLRKQNMVCIALRRLGLTVSLIAEKAQRDLKK